MKAPSKVDGAALGFGSKRLADEVASKPADDNVLAKFRNFSVEQFFDRNIRIFDETLLEQTDRAVELVEFPIDNFFSHVRGLSFDLRLVNFALGFDQFPRNIFATDIERVRRRDVERDVFHETAEIFVLGHEISFAIYFDEHADFALQMNVRSDDAFLRHT